MPGTVRVAVLGATGYAGRELIALLARHPNARIVGLMSSGRSQASGSQSSQPFPIERSLPVLRGAGARASRPLEAPATLCYPLNLADLTPSEVDLVFLATPHETSLDVVPVLLERGVRVIDLSGGFEHHAAGALEEAVYGSPELNAAAIQKAQLVSNPGCYATSVILALAPLIKAEWLDVDAGIICDAKSGASGAGRAPSDKLHFAEVNENCRAYGPFTHRHIPEMLQALALEEENFTFTPHLLPITRGILTTVYTRLRVRHTAEEVVSLFQDSYYRAPLVRVYESGLPEIQAVAHTNYADLGFALEPSTRRLVVVSALDNLGKGAAGQAVENMNLMYGFPQETALA
ncbi:MAG: N-acetyl-gamma-glutamyl-phosphate reductase [Acidobacteria bacterium]|nr:MAG: N-acetyl-gamma-glutamyl-phosphate reductase [Acidobacteriota bacterium]